MLCKVVLTFESVDEILKCDRSYETESCLPVALFIMTYTVMRLCMKSLRVTIQMNAIEQYFPVVVFITL